MSTGEPILETHGLRTWFKPRGQKGTVRAVDGVTLQIYEGEILGLVGESGCGKTTLSRAILQLAPITHGSVTWKDTDLGSLSPGKLRTMRREWQYVFQDPYSSLNPRFTVFDTLGEAMRRRHPKLRGEELRKRVGALLEQVGLARNHLRRYPHEFSGGQRQRIAIARALATDPELIIADEPVSALDVSVQAQILNLLNALRKERSLTMLFVSHDLSVVHYLADRIAVMQAGQLVEIGPANAVMENPQHAYTQTLLAAIPMPDPSRRNSSRKLHRTATTSPYADANAPMQPEPVFDEVSPGHLVARDSAES